MKLFTGSISLAIFLCLMLFVGCKKTDFTGTFKSKDWPAPLPPVPTPVFLTLNVISVRPDAWWKNCLYVIANGDEKNAYYIGCNKEANIAGKQVGIVARPEHCNSLRFVANVHQNVQPCSKGSDCIISETPTCQRQSQRTKDKPFFVFSRGESLGNLDKRVSQEDKVIAKKNMELSDRASKVDASLKLIRMFFEDQDDMALTLFEKDRQSPDWKVRAGAREATGIDFNDMIFDLEVQRLDVAIEGTDIACTKPLPPDYVPPPPNEGGCTINGLRPVNSESSDKQEKQEKSPK